MPAVGHSDAAAANAALFGISTPLIFLVNRQTDPALPRRRSVTSRQSIAKLRR